MSFGNYSFNYGSSQYNYGSYGTGSTNGTGSTSGAGSTSGVGSTSGCGSTSGTGSASGISDAEREKLDAQYYDYLREANKADYEHRQAQASLNSTYAEYKEIKDALSSKKKNKNCQYTDEDLNNARNAYNRAVEYEIGCQARYQSALEKLRSFVADHPEYEYKNR